MPAEAEKEKIKNTDGPDRILIIDGHGLAYRAFYAIADVFSAPDGTRTNAIMGVMNMLFHMLDEVRPGCCAAVFDSPGPTFRHRLLPQYKANRKPSPDNFRPQIPILQKLLRLTGCSVLTPEPGTVEADDLIGSLALSAARRGLQAVILSSDKDLLQVLGDGVIMLRPLKGGVSAAERYDTASFEGEYGFAPSSMPDYLALIGDSSDNVPGVAGVGEKTAKQLISEWGTLENIYDSLEAVKPAVRKKLEAAGRENAFMSRELIRLKLDEPVNLDACLSFRADLPAAEELAGQLALSRVLAYLKKIENQTEASGTNQERKPRQTYVRAPEPKPAKYTQGHSRKAGPPVIAVNVSPDKFEADTMALVPLETEIERGRFLVAARSGERAECSRDELRGLLKKTAGKTKILVKDYKSLLSQNPGLLDETLDIWDLRTAHYLLHPDATARDFAELVPVDADLCLELFPLADSLNREIDSHEGLRELMEKTDLPLLPVLDRMERRGVRLDRGRFETLRQELEARISVIETKIAERAGVVINLNSPRQISELLFERMGLEPEGRTRGGRGGSFYSTDAAVLERLARLPDGEVPGLILEYRELTKMLNSFVIPFQAAADAGGGIIRTTFEAAGTGTGRLSSHDPNLQNIPAFGHWAGLIKNALVPVKEGNVFVAADYSQIELRVLAHLSREPRLLEAFHRGRDIHRETASWVFSTPPELVTPELRRTAKTINFGLLYGMNSFGLAERLDVPRAEAAAIVKRYFDALPDLRDFLDRLIGQAMADGFTRTLAGRIRPLAEVSAIKKHGAARRVMINAPIQGTAADIVRRAMIDFDRAFSSDEAVRLFLQVHDSLICECPSERAEEVGLRLCEIMKGAADLLLPLEVELKTGHSLAEV